MHDTEEIQVATLIIFLFLSQIYILSNFQLGKQNFSGEMRNIGQLWNQELKFLHKCPNEEHHVNRSLL